MKHAALVIGLMSVALLNACVHTTKGDIQPKANPIQAAQINLQLGYDYMQQGDLGTAKQKLERARTEDPHNVGVHSALGLLYDRLGQADDADKEFRTSLTLAPKDPSTINQYAVYLCSHGRAPEGVRYFEQAANNPLYRTPWVAYTNAGVCLHGAKRDAEAAQLFARALQSNPAYAEAVFQAADLDLAQHNYAEARGRIELFLSHNIATPDLLLLGYRVALAQNDAVAQAIFAARLLKEYPNSEQARALTASRTNPG